MGDEGATPRKQACDNMPRGGGLRRWKGKVAHRYLPELGRLLEGILLWYVV